MTTSLRLPRAALLALLPFALVISACAVTAGTTAPTPTNTPVATTCAQLAGFSGATPINIPNTGWPKDAIGAAPTTVGGGAGQFSVSEFDGCAPNTDTSLTVMTGKGPKPFYNLQEFYGWAPGKTFPKDGEVQSACGTNECLDFSDEHTRFLSVTNATALPNNLVKFHVRYATPPTAPTCGANFASSPLQGYQLTSFFDAPLPPLTRAAPDNASGGLRGMDLCSAGTTASVTAFMLKALPLAGWTKGSDSKCFYGDQCWTKGGNAISWHVNSATDWLVAYRQPLT